MNPSGDERIINLLAEVLEETDYDWSHESGVRTGSDAYKVKATHHIAALRAAGIAVVDLPEPDMVSPEWGAVWTTEHRHQGHIGDVQFRPQTGRVEIRDDYEHDYAPEDVAKDAAVLLAAAYYKQE